MAPLVAQPVTNGCGALADLERFGNPVAEAVRGRDPRGTDRVVARAVIEGDGRHYMPLRCPRSTTSVRTRTPSGVVTTSGRPENGDTADCGCGAVVRRFGSTIRRRMSTGDGVLVVKDPPLNPPPPADPLRAPNCRDKAIIATAAPMATNGLSDASALAALSMSVA